MKAMLNSTALRYKILYKTIHYRALTTKPANLSLTAGNYKVERKT